MRKGLVAGRRGLTGGSLRGGVQAAIAVCAFALTGIASAQPPDTLWTKTYPGELSRDDCRRLISTSDGGFLVGGTAYRGDTEYEYGVVKTDSEGELLSARTYGAVNEESPNQADIFYGIAEAPDGTIYVVGEWHGADFAHILQIDTEGDTIGGSIYGREGLYDICVGGDGYAVAAGYSSSMARRGPWDGWIVKIDEERDVVWEDVYGGDGGDIFQRIIPANDGGYLLAGQTTSEGGLKGWIAKVDTDGQLQWSNAVSDNQENHVFSCIIETSDGGLLAGGTGRQDDDNRYYLVKFTADGDSIWSRKWGSQRRGRDDINGLANAPGGGYLVVGVSDDNSYAAIRLDTEGEILWEFDLGQGMLSNELQAVLVLDDGGYLLGGHKSVQGVSTEFWLIRTAPDSTMLHNDVVLLDPAFPYLFGFTQPYPNPFNSSVQLSYSIPRSSETSIRIYNQLGHQVADLYDGRLGAGQHTAIWDASRQATGVYFCKIVAGGNTATTKVMLVK